MDAHRKLAAALALGAAALALAVSAGAQEAAAPLSGPACGRAAAPPLPLSRPFLAADSLALLRGEVVANAAGGRGSLVVEYLSRPAPADSGARRREAAALSQAITPVAGGIPFATLTLRACRADASGLALVEGFDFAQDSGGAWRPVPPPEPRPRRPD
jgi:hypothetical protein